MPEIGSAKIEQQTPQAQLIQMATAHWVSGVICVAAQMSLADHLAEAPRTAADLAPSMKCDASSLYRMMRALAGMGVLTEGSDHRFSLAPLGEALRTGTPGSVRSAVLSLAGDWNRKTLGELHYSVQTGKPAFEKVFGVGLFEWLAKHPVDASTFSETMVGFHGAEPEAVAKAYDFSQFETVIDIGGATGNLLTAILSHHRTPRGLLFDLPHVVGDAPALIKARGLADRIAIEPGSFFESVPAASGAYMLSHVIHDWGADQCVTILGNCRRAMKPGSRLLIIEMVLPTGNTPHLGKMLDIVMLAAVGGQERTEPEYRELLEKSGFQLRRTVPTESAVSVVEASPI
ncbi:MAG TPA: methyltransferase [Xanthobacteraceae bacterium]|nr:methyltransferase [Xanthobacteraceae bacterium]